MSRNAPPFRRAARERAASYSSVVCQVHCFMVPRLLFIALDGVGELPDTGSFGRGFRPGVIDRQPCPVDFCDAALFQALLFCVYRLEAARRAEKRSGLRRPNGTRQSFRPYRLVGDTIGVKGFLQDALPRFPVSVCLLSHQALLLLA